MSDVVVVMAGNFATQEINPMMLKDTFIKTMIFRTYSGDGLKELIAFLKAAVRKAEVNEVKTV
jgi:hypothetical protein